MNVLEKLCLDLKLDISYLKPIVARSRYYYKDYYIKKKNGGVRQVSQPSPELKTLQYWILNNILRKIPISKAACAYNKGNSIKTHALLHCSSRYVLHSDICNFFPSIHIAHLIPILKVNKQIFDNLGIDELETSILQIGMICFRGDTLCIGAVSSPAISNIVMTSFDEELYAYCQERDYIYSRYADDIYISSKDYIDEDIVKTIRIALEKNGFLINLKKTRFFSTKYRRMITGIILTNDSKISVGTNRRNLIKKMVYDKLVHGKGDSEQILGYLSFLKDVEPQTYNNIIIKFARYCSGDVIAELRK